jgi:hypothetical protein
MLKLSRRDVRNIDLSGGSWFPIMIKRRRKPPLRCIGRIIHYEAAHERMTASKKPAAK